MSKVRPGWVGKNLPKSLQGAQVSFTGRLPTDAQDLGYFVVPQLFKMAQGQHLAVERVHRFERGPKSILKFAAHRGLTGRGQVTHELAGH